MPNLHKKARDRQEVAAANQRDHFAKVVGPMTRAGALEEKWRRRAAKGGKGQAEAQQKADYYHQKKNKQVRRMQRAEPLMRWLDDNALSRKKHRGKAREAAANKKAKPTKFVPRVADGKRARVVATHRADIAGTARTASRAVTSPSKGVDTTTKISRPKAPIGRVQASTTPGRSPGRPGNSPTSATGRAPAAVSKGIVKAPAKVFNNAVTRGRSL